MAKRLRNNLSKRRTRQNTLRRKRRKKYTRGGRPLLPWVKKGTLVAEQQAAKETLVAEQQAAQQQQKELSQLYVTEIEKLKHEIEKLKHEIEKLKHEKNILKSMLDELILGIKNLLAKEKVSRRVENRLLEMISDENIQRMISEYSP